MPARSKHSSCSIDFSKLMDHEGKVSMSRVEAFLDQLVALAAEQAELAPNQLVRIVHGKKVTWMTQKQAVEYLEEAKDENLLQDVEQALRGDLKIVRQELEILLAIAFYTLKQFKENQAISQKDINRLEPSFQRRQKEMSECFTNTAEAEALMYEKRRKNPLLDEYEELMGQFLEEKRQGNMAKAMNLANHLKEKKKHYLLLSRAIEPDVQTIYYHRMTLQKTKKRIINSQNQLCQSRKDSLQFEIGELQDNLNAIKQNLELAQEEGFESATSQIEHNKLYEMDEHESKIQEKSGELQALNAESDILQHQEQQVDSVINHIAENVLQEGETKVNLNSIKKTSSKIKSKPSQNSDSQTEQVSSAKRSGMHFRRK